MRCESVFFTRIAQTNDQFHGAILVDVGTTALGCPAERSSAFLTTELFFLLLLGFLLALLDRSLALFLGLCLALLDDLRLGRSRSRFCRCRFRRRDNLFLHRR